MTSLSFMDFAVNFSEKIFVVISFCGNFFARIVDKTAKNAKIRICKNFVQHGII